MKRSSSRFDLVGAVRRGRAKSADDELVIAGALLAGAARHRRAMQLRWAGFAAGAVALAAVVLLWVRGTERSVAADVPVSVAEVVTAEVLVAETSSPTAPTPSAPSSPTLVDADDTAVAPSAELLRLQLVSGDRLTAVGGSRFRVTHESRVLRRIALDDGAMLFDVVRAAPVQRFEVRTPQVTVTVLGTVFAVEVAGDHTVVRVFEGRVQVSDGEGTHVLTAGEQYGASGTAIGALDAGGREAAATRQATEASERAAEVRRPDEGSERVTSSVERITTAVDDRAVANDSPASEPPAEGAARSTWSIATARRRIAAGEGAVVLEEVRHELAASGESAALRWVEADALRATRRYDEAIAAYRRLAGENEPRRHEAAFVAASLLFQQRHAPDAALTVIRDAGLTLPSSPLRERALALSARSLAAVGRTAELQAVAREYLASYPNQGAADWMADVLEGPEAP